MSEKPTTTKEQPKKTKKAAKAPKEKMNKKEDEKKKKATKPARVERQKKTKKAATQTNPRKAEKKKGEAPEVEEKKDVGDQPAAVVVKKDLAPQVPVPMPAVSARHEALLKMRKARGFSVPEISSAGLNIVSVKRWGVPFDRRRKSMLPENAEKLKAWLKSPRGAISGGRSGRKSGSRSRKKE